VKLWSVFVPQSVRECQEYYPQVLELPKEHLKRLRERGELVPDESPGEEAEERRRSYLEQRSARSWKLLMTTGSPGW